MTVVIGLLGPAGSGKSTVAKHLIDVYGAKRYSLATPLKEIAKRVMNFSEPQLYGSQEEKEAVDPRYGFSCRTFLQKLGTEGIREVLGDDIWYTLLLKKIWTDALDLAVVDDLRFINEACAFQSADRDYPGMWGYVWKLYPPEDSVSKARESAAAAHKSEEQWRTAPYDTFLHPDKRGIPELLNLVDNVIRIAYPQIFKKRPALPL